MDKIAKQKFNVVVVVDTSRSMQGPRMKQVNSAIVDILDYLKELQEENANVDFYLSILKFGTDVSWHMGEKAVNVENYQFKPIEANGKSNLHYAYHELAEVFKKESDGGMMPDFGGLAPIVLLLSDGHPSPGPVKDELAKLKKLKWFQVALKYGIAIELNDTRTLKVLKEFVGNDGEVIEVYNSQLLKRVIQIIIVTASKIQSKSRESKTNTTNTNETISYTIKQNIQTALDDNDEDWEF